MQELVTQSNFVSFILSKKFDIALVLFILALAFTYSSYVSQLQVPTWDGAIYLENAQNWLANEPLEASYRPPLLSWIIAGVWSVTGEDWTIAKFIQPIFTISAGLLLYKTLKKYKGDFFAFSVTALTMLNSYVFLYSTQILTEGLSLFFLMLSISCLKSEKRFSLILAGMAIGLTFGSRYPIFVLAFAIFVIELFARTGERKKIFVNTVIGILPIMLLVILAVYAKSGTFSVAIERDTQQSINCMRLLKFILETIAIVGKKNQESKLNVYRYNYCNLGTQDLSIKFSIDK